MEVTLQLKGPRPSCSPSIRTGAAFTHASLVPSPGGAPAPRICGLVPSRELIFFGAPNTRICPTGKKAQ